MELALRGDVVCDPAGGAFPVLIQATSDGADLAAWARGQAEALNDAVVAHGALLFRGFAVSTPARFEAVSNEMCGPLLDYVYRSTPRSNVGKGVYTATEYRADAVIPLHNENAYQRDWPMKIAFNCQRRADTGGETPLARIDRVSARIDGAVRAAAAKGVMYVRNFGQGVDLPWQVGFQTESKAVVEAYCREHGITCEWLDDERLRTTQVCQAFARHPVTGVELWFNQAHLFHVSSLGAAHSRAMLQVFDERDLPRHAYWGDGSPIADDQLAHIRDAYEQESLVFGWQEGDVLLCDNMLVAHGRQPFTGSRTVLVAMGDPCGARTAAGSLARA